MQTLIIANILVILFNISLIFFLFYELVKIKREFNEKLSLVESFERRLNELSKAVKILTKASLEKLKTNKEKSKVISFKPEDLDKIKEQLNVSNST
jgi:cell division protein FtsL